MSHVHIRGLALGGLMAVLLTVPARGADLETLDTSLKIVPAEAAFYSASLRNREQYQIVAKSKAVATFLALESVKKAWREGSAELSKPGGAYEVFENFRKDPENQQLLDLLVDMVSSEVFVYGDESLNQVLDLYVRIANANRLGTLTAMAKPENRGKDPNEIQARVLLKALNDHLDLIKVPDMVIGFRLSNTERAEAQIKRLEGMLKGPINQNPQTKGRLKRIALGGKDFLTFSLDGGLIPLDELKIDKYEKEKGEYDKLRKKIQSLTLTVSMGVRDQYMLLSIGGGTKHITKLGKGKSLATRPEFAPLAKHADKRLTEINYVSKELRSKFALSKKDVDDMLNVGRETLKNVDEISEPIKKRLEKDMEDLAKDVKASIGEVGASAGFAFLTPTGQEAFAYDWSEHRSIDGSKPLSMAQHLGGNPIFAIVNRAKYDPDSYALTVKWMKTVYSYVDEFAVPQLDEQQKAIYEQATKIAFPILKRIDNATGKMILPAFADGQSGLVIDAKWTAKQWFPQQPESAKPLPMLELGFLSGVSDADKLKKGFVEYRAVINDVLALANNYAQGQFPEAKIPEPETKKIAGGTMYFYPITQLPGIDRRLLPNAALSENLLVLTLHEEMSERLLSKKPLKTECKVLDNLNRPLAGASYFNFAGLIDAAAPWVDYAIDNSGVEVRKVIKPGANPEPLKQPDNTAVKKEAAVVLDVLRCFRCVGTVSYFEDKALVSHTETVLRDLK